MQLAGPLNITDDAINQYDDAYVKALSNTVRPFGGAETLFEPPVLEVDFFLKPPTGPLPTTRNPMARFIRVPDAGTIVPGGGEALIAILPVFGRKGINVQARAFGAGGNNIAGTIRLGSITFQSGFNPPHCSEVTVASLTIDSATGKTCALISGNLSQYIAIYQTVTGDPGCHIAVQVLADDDGTCCSSLGTP